MSAKNRLKKPEPERGKHIAPPVAKAPQVGDYPVFCFRFLQPNFGISDCSQEEQQALIQQLGALSQMTWQEIYQAPRHGLGTEKIAQSAIRPPLPLVLTEDIGLIAFRFSGVKPMVGFRDTNVFRLLWLDHSRTVYNHG